MLRAGARSTVTLLTALVLLSLPRAGFAEWSDPFVLADQGTGVVVGIAQGDSRLAVAAWVGPSVVTRTRSSDGVWSETQTVSSRSGASAPVLAVDRDGNALYVWRTPNGKIWARARSAGGVLGAEKIISPVGVPASWPQTAVDAAGNAVVTWLVRDDDAWHIQLRARSAAGAWGATQTIATGSSRHVSYELAAGAAGTAVVVWETADDRYRQGQVFARSRSATGALSARQAISRIGKPPFQARVAVDPAGTAVIVWTWCTRDQCRVQTRTMSAAGARTPVQNISPIGDYINSPDVAVDDAGTAVFAWKRHRFEQDGVVVNFHVIETRTRSATGERSRVQRVRDRQLTIFVRVAVTPAGDAVIMWLDDSTSRVETRTRAASGELGPLEIAAPGNATRPSLALDVDGNAVIVWAHQFSLDVLAQTGP